jgi:hypothetical protein
MSTGLNAVYILLLFVLWNVPMLLLCRSLWKQHQREHSNAALQFSLRDLLLTALAIGLAFQWLLSGAPRVGDWETRAMSRLIFLLPHVLGGVFIVRLALWSDAREYTLARSLRDVALGVLLGLIGLPFLTVMSIFTLPLWGPYWLFHRWRNRQSA